MPTLESYESWTTGWSSGLVGSVRPGAWIAPAPSTDTIEASVTVAGFAQSTALLLTLRLPVQVLLAGLDLQNIRHELSDLS
jgi:hypothetical protein